MKHTIAKKMTRDELKRIPGFTKIWVACVNDDTMYGLLWHWIAPAVIFNSGNDPIIVPDLVNGIAVYEVDDDFFAQAPYISFWNKKPDHKQLEGISEEEFNLMTEPDCTELHLLKAEELPSLP